MALEFAMDALGEARVPNTPARSPEGRARLLASHTGIGEKVGGLPALHNSKPKEPGLYPGLQKEQPWHRMAAFMLLAGRTNSEIAAAAEKSISEVSILRHQRWFQELLALLANEAGQDVVGLIQSEAVASLERIVSLRDTSESDRVQLAAAQFLVEQANGKAVQKTVSVVSHTTYKGPEDELAAINQELKVLRESKQGADPAVPPQTQQPT